MWFTKQISCINKPYGDVLKPETTMMLDYEVELALIIGKQCNQIKASDFKNKIDLTIKLNKILEEMITRNPTQWIWTHNRWK